MDKDNIQRFELPGHLLQYDLAACALLCRSIPDGKNLWIRKIEDGGFIIDANEDESNIYVSFGYDEKSGQFLVLNKGDGLTNWSIPGRAYMFRVFMGSVYLIFPDAEGNFFLIKTSSGDGSKIWHHPVGDGLHSYTINERTVTLEYYGGETEVLSSTDGILARYQ